MAKRGALEHPKTMDLAASLGIDDCFALGILEAFWHHVARYFPSGEITSAKPHLVARSIRYSGDAQALFDGMLDAGFVDRTEDGRTIVHDWSEHADDAVHMALARKGLYFADGVKPRTSRLSQRERDASEALYAQENAHRAQVSAFCAHTVRTASALPEPEPKPEPCSSSMAAGAAPSEPSSAAAKLARKVSKAEADQAWGEFLDIYPARDGDRGAAKGREKFDVQLRSGVPPGELLEGARRYRRWTDAKGDTGTRFVKQIPTWFNGKCWEEPFEVRNVQARSIANGNGKAHESPADIVARVQRERLEREASETRERQLIQR